MDFKNLSSGAGKKNIPGTAAFLFIQNFEVFTAMPEVDEDSVAVGGQVIALGDYAFAVGGPQGFAKIPIIVDTGEMIDTLAGELAGTKATTNDFNFQLAGTDEEKLEFYQTLMCYDGYSHAVVPLRNGKRRMMGNMLIPCQLKTASAGSGKKAGEPSQGTFTLYSDTGLPAPFLPDATAVTVLT